MTTTVAPNEPAPSRRRTLRIILLTTGSAVLVALIVSAIVIVGGAVGAKRSNASTHYSITNSFDAVQINAEAADVTVQYANVDSAHISFHQGTEIRTSTLHQVVTDGVLIVTETAHGNVPFGWMAGDATKLEIVLPRSLETSSLGVVSTIQAGNLDLNGTFAALAINTNSGNIALHGGARSLNLKDQSGNVTATSYVLHGPITSTTNAGDSTYDFSTLPSRATLTTSAGNISFIVPRGSYQITSRSLAGTVHQAATSTPGASRAYTLHDSAGNITVSNR